MTIYPSIVNYLFVTYRWRNGSSKPAIQTRGIWRRCFSACSL